MTFIALSLTRRRQGIGKTSLAKQCAHFVLERRMFSTGVLFVHLREVASAEALVAILCRALDAGEGTLGGGGGGGGSVLMSPRSSVISAPSIASTPDCPTPGVGAGAVADASVHALVSALRGAHALLVLDNCEDVLSADAGGVRECLERLLQGAQGVHLLLTSRQAVGGGLVGTTEKVFGVPRLGPAAAACLLLHRCPRPLQREEAGLPASASAAALHAALGRHPLLCFLDGHPQAIALAAPLLQDRTLAEVHALVAARGVQELQVTDMAPSARSATNTLAASLAASVAHVQRRRPEAVALFALMGLLPAGVLEVDLDAMWGSPLWRDLAHVLLRASIIEQRLLRAPCGMAPQVQRVLAQSVPLEGGQGRGRGAAGAPAHPSVLSPQRTSGSSVGAAARAPPLPLFGLAQPAIAEARHGDAVPGIGGRAGGGDGGEEGALVLWSTFPFITSFAQRLLAEGPRSCGVEAEAGREAGAGEEAAEWSLAAVQARMPRRALLQLACACERAYLHLGTVRATAAVSHRRRARGASLLTLGAGGGFAV